jgi:hypothetical protein
LARREEHPLFAIDALVDDGVLEEVTGQQRNKEYRAREIFEILERPPRTY